MNRGLTYSSRGVFAGCWHLMVALVNNKQPI
jgi:hypothetical protein